jgi:hypothetical protein
LLWADLASAPFGTANGSEDNGIGGFGSSEGFIRQWFAV